MIAQAAISVATGRLSKAGMADLHIKRLCTSLTREVVVFVCILCVNVMCATRASTLAQRKRVGLITQRSLDRDQQVLSLSADLLRLVSVLATGAYPHGVF